MEYKKGSPNRYENGVEKQQLSAVDMETQMTQTFEIPNIPVLNLLCIQCAVYTQLIAIFERRLFKMSLIVRLVGACTYGMRGLFLDESFILINLSSSSS